MAKILLVEDDLTVAEPIAAWLKNESHTVETVTSGDDAVQLLEHFSFDAIVLDWELPGMNGCKVLQRFREMGGNSPVIFLTGRKDLDSKTSGLDCGADDYLVKPCDPRELSARLRSVLRRPGLRTDSKVLCLGGLSLHPETGKVLIKDKAARLTSKEFAVLEFLMQHSTEAFSARDLLKHIWTTDSLSSEEAVRKLMSRLRRKLESFGAPGILKTETGGGYTVCLEAVGTLDHSEDDPDPPED
jgi:two-component system, OmpR family, manganese sensing response regulator